MQEEHRLEFGYGRGLAQRSRLGIYFHVPFCPHICPYCDFVKTSKFSKQDVDRFFAAAERQLKKQIASVPETLQVCTVYFGGGTPGLFLGDRYQSLLETVRNRFEIEEITIETNPFTNSERSLKSYFEMGFTRLTLGAQSIDDNVLKALGRKHSPRDVIENIENARSLGFKQVQVDLIYGLKPGTRSNPIEEEVKALVQYGATGISSYALSLEARTQFANTDWAHEDVAVSEYSSLVDVCAEIGMQQLETSNFSFFPALHNNIYWYGLPYLGIGTGAHGLLPATQDAPLGRRYSVGLPVTERSPGDDLLEFSTREDELFCLQFEEPRTEKEYFDEMVFTLLRTPTGLPWDWLNEQRNDGKVVLMSSPLVQRAISEDLLQVTESALHISSKEKIRGDAWCLQLCSLLNS